MGSERHQLTARVPFARLAGSDWVVGQSKRNHPEIWGPSEVGHIVGGRIGREILGGMFFIYCAALAGSGLLSLSISLNAVSIHALCTAGWVAIVTGIGFGLSSIQTLDKVSWLGWVGMVSILSARESLLVPAARLLEPNH